MRSNQTHTLPLKGALRGFLAALVVVKTRWRWATCGAERAGAMPEMACLLVRLTACMICMQTSAPGVIRPASELMQVALASCQRRIYEAAIESAASSAKQAGLTAEMQVYMHDGKAEATCCQQA